MTGWSTKLTLEFGRTIGGGGGGLGALAASGGLFAGGRFTGIGCAFATGGGGFGTFFIAGGTTCGLIGASDSFLMFCFGKFLGSECLIGSGAGSGAGVLLVASVLLASKSSVSSEAIFPPKPSNVSRRAFVTAHYKKKNNFITRLH